MPFALVNYFPRLERGYSALISGRLIRRRCAAGISLFLTRQGRRCIFSRNLPSSLFPSERSIIHGGIRN